jgi:hypothetical protein
VCLSRQSYQLITEQGPGKTQEQYANIPSPISQFEKPKQQILSLVKWNYLLSLLIVYDLLYKRA